MGQIPLQDARNLFTKAIADVYKEKSMPTGFLKSFFTAKEFMTKEISIEVERGFEKVAVDVTRGTLGNRNSFSKSTEKIFVPPYFREFFDATELDLYDRMFGESSVNEMVFGQFVSSVAEKLQVMQAKIERAYELQCASVLTTGILTLADGSTIDFKRKGASIVDESGTTWATGTNSPYETIKKGGDFLRKAGKMAGGTVNVLLGDAAYTALLDNAIVQKRSDIKNWSMDSIVPAQRMAVGSVYHGTVDAGSYKANLWTYPQFYTNAGGVDTAYLDTKKIIIMPETPRFLLAYAAVPQLISSKNPMPQKGAFIFGDYMDEREGTHVYDIKSAGVAIPVAVDQIYTAKVLA